MNTSIRNGAIGLAFSAALALGAAMPASAAPVTSNTASVGKADVGMVTTVQRRGGGGFARGGGWGGGRMGGWAGPRGGVYAGRGWYGGRGWGGRGWYGPGVGFAVGALAGAGLAYPYYYSSPGYVVVEPSYGYADPYWEYYD